MKSKHDEVLHAIENIAWKRYCSINSDNAIIYLDRIKKVWEKDLRLTLIIEGMIEGYQVKI